MRVTHYLNQFFGQIGGEEHAGVPPRLVEGTVGAGALLDRTLGDAARVTHTVICGDNYFSEHTEEALGTIVEQLEEAAPDLVVAGPAFMAGRYGLACMQVAAAAADRLGVPAVAGLAPGNPAADDVRPRVLVVPTGTDAGGMRDAVDRIASLALKVGRGQPLGLPEEDGYLPRGLRLNVLDERTGAERAIAMLKAKIAGEHVETEIPLPEVEDVPPAAALADLSGSVVALATSGGLVPAGNPDRLKSHHSDFWRSYEIDGQAGFEKGRYEAVHGGFYVQYVNDDPNRLLPLDALLDMVEAGELGGVHHRYYTIAGNGTDPEVARKMARAMAEELKAAHVDAVLASAT